MRRRVPGWLYGICLAVLLLAPAISYAAEEPSSLPSPSPSGMQVEAPPGSYVVQYVNRQAGGPFIGFLARLTGTSSPEPCDGKPIRFFASTPGASVRIAWGPFRDDARAHNLTDGFLTLQPIDSPNCGTAPVSGELVLAEQTSRYFAAVLSPQPGHAGVRPGTYQGELIVGDAPEARVIPVTVQVRDSVGVAILFTLLGLLTNWVVNWFRLREQLTPLLTRYRRLSARLRSHKAETLEAAPLLLDHLETWIRANLNLASDRARSLAEAQLEIAEMLMSSQYYSPWVTELDQLEPENDYAWRKVRASIERLSAQADERQVYEAVNSEVQRWVTLTAPGTRLVDGALRGVNGPSAGEEPWYLQLQHFVATQFFAGSTLASIWIIRVAIFSGAIAATMLASAAAYQEIPEFGANPLVHYGLAFMVGYGGKVFNDFLQKVAPNLNTTVAINATGPAGGSQAGSSSTDSGSTGGSSTGGNS